LPAGPGNGGEVFRYKLHERHGGDLGEASYAKMIIRARRSSPAPGQPFRVVDLVEFDERDESAFVGLLRVEAA